MSVTTDNPLYSLANATPMEAVRARTAEGGWPETAEMGGVNAHIHLPPNFSAFESVSEVVRSAAREGVRVLGASNYYDYSIYAEFVRQAMAHGVYPLLGIEIVARDADLAERGIKVNDPGNPGKIYLCGKGITRFHDISDQAARILGYIREKDASRMAGMVSSIHRHFASRDIPLPSFDRFLFRQLATRYQVPEDTVFLQERHLARAFQEAIFERVPVSVRAEKLSRAFGSPYNGDPEDTVTVQNEIRNHLMKAGKPGFRPEEFVTPEDAKTLVLEMGGFPCYPTFADGGGAFTPFEAPVEALIDNIRGLGIHAAEFIPTRNSPDVLAEYVPAMRAAGLVVSAGTEHNTLDRAPLTPTARGGATIPDEVQRIFDEGACVIAAHQFLALSGETGYVDAEGNPNPAHATDEERIVSLARIGAAVLDTYFKQADL